MTFLYYVLWYLGIAYVLGAVWFLIIERKDGFTKWRVIATLASPIALPLLVLAGIGLKVIDATISAKDAADKE